MAFNTITLVPNGATGNNTHTAVDLNVGDPVTIEFIVQVAGATPTVTWKAQGSMDNSNFYDVNYVTDSSDTAAATTRVATAVGRQIIFVSLGTYRKYRYYRIVTTSNTNVTYAANIYVTD